MSKGKFAIVINGEVILDVDEIWPDGDAPANPTSQDVLKAAARGKASVRISDVLEEWNMEHEFEFDAYAV